MSIHPRNGRGVPEEVWMPDDWRATILVPGSSTSGHSHARENEFLPCLGHCYIESCFFPAESDPEWYNGQHKIFWGRKRTGLGFERWVGPRCGDGGRSSLRVLGTARVRSVLGVVCGVWQGVLGANRVGATFWRQRQGEKIQFQLISIGAPLKVSE